IYLDHLRALDLRIGAQRGADRPGKARERIADAVGGRVSLRSDRVIELASVLRKRRGGKLVHPLQFAFVQSGALVADVAYFDHKIPDDLALDIEVPLLDVRCLS